MKIFGVGCLNFSFKSGLDGEITVQEYTEEVRKSLEKLSTVRDVEIYFDEDVKNENIDISLSSHMNDGDHCYPHILFFELSFGLYLPKRIQANITNCKPEYLDTNTDNFRVTIKHDWHGPFTIVECIGADSKASPSTAIQIVREYLKKEISTVSDILQLDYVGPSPFHADFYLSQDSTRKSD